MSNDELKTPVIDRRHIEYITAGFSDHSLPEEEWTHEAHLVTGLWLLQENGLSRAENMMPDMIRSFNEAKGGTNSDTEGYHHTITIFYLRVLDEFRKGQSAQDPLKVFEKMLESPVAAKMYPLNYYSKDLLFSVDARRRFILPDLKSI